MEYTKDNIVGVLVRHHSHKEGDKTGVYEIIGATYNSVTIRHWDGKKYANYTFNDIDPGRHIREGKWIVIEEPSRAYEIY